MSVSFIKSLFLCVFIVMSSGTVESLADRCMTTFQEIAAFVDIKEIK